MTRNITENLLVNNVLYKQVFQKEDVAENTTQQEKASDLSQMQKRYDIIEYQDSEDSAGIYELKKMEAGYCRSDLIIPKTKILMYLII